MNTATSQQPDFDYAAFDRWLSGQYRKVDARKAELDQIRQNVESAHQQGRVTRKQLPGESALDAIRAGIRPHRPWAGGGTQDQFVRFI